MFLTCHPNTPAPAVRSIEVNLARLSNHRFLLRYRLIGDLRRLLIPPTTAATRTDGLWKHSCFEVFIARPGETGYREFNFSPSGQWAVYAFSDYRQREPSADPMSAPAITVRHFADGLALEALVSCDAHALPAGCGTDALAVGLSAVVESTEGKHSYWALAHPFGEPTPKPDFHRRETFILEC